MRVADHRWPWIAFAVVLFVLVMSFLHYMTRGINQDFGFGFAMGGIVGLLIGLLAVARQRGELER